jgi:hypothetical protein
MQLGEPLFFRAESKPYGQTYGRWTVNWWRWFLSTPKPINPVFDSIGEYSHINQPLADVWYLIGKLASREITFPKRRCRLPAGRSVLFPVINFEANPLEFPGINTNQGLTKRVEAEEDSITKAECFVNGVAIPPQRVKSDPIIFDLILNEDNAISVKGGGSTVASADGYWIFLKPLPAGTHAVSFEGSCMSGKIRSGANYLLEVID